MEASWPNGVSIYPDELRVGWLPLEERDLGFTLLPGRKGVGSGGSVHHRDLDWDLGYLARRGVEQLIVLAEDDELAASDAREIVERGLRAGVCVVRRPIPPSGPLPAFDEMDEIVHLASSPTVYVCPSGLGRSGLVAACALVSRGASAKDALAMVRIARGPKAAGGKRREAYLAKYGAHQPSSDLATLWSIKTPRLRRAHLPPPRAPWHLLGPFALTFDGYRIAPDPGSIMEPLYRQFDDAGELPATMTIDEARAALWFVQRAFHWRLGDADKWYDPGPRLHEMRLGWAVVEYLRLRLPA